MNMHSNRPVTVLQVPEQLNQAQAESFLSELNSVLQSERPRIVLDCSEVQSIESAGVEVLLHIMQEAMKRDGDVKLAGLPPMSMVILELMKVDRLFEVFETPDEAVRSFHALPAYSIPAEQQWLGHSGGELETAS